MIFSHDFNHTALQHEKYGTELTLSLSATEADSLREHLLPAITDSKEVLLRLGMYSKERWTLYWKVKETSNQVYLAHPSLEEWVATLALQKKSFEKLLEKLSLKESFSLAEFTQLGAFSNFHVRVEIS